MIGHSQTPADELLDRWPHLRRSQRVQEFQGLPHEYMDDCFLTWMRNHKRNSSFRYLKESGACSCVCWRLMMPPI